MEEEVLRVRIAQRHYFSTNFLWTALHNSRVVGELEAAPGDLPRFDMEHRSYAVSAVIAAASFLEATVSELFQDAADQHVGYIEHLGPAPIHRMSCVWRATNNGWTLQSLEKWQWLLECAGEERLNPGTAPMQHAALLVQLRNVLAHWKSETIWFDDPHKLEMALRTKFAPNRLMQGSGNPWWPSEALGQGCTNWAITAARSLADAVLNRLAIQPNYQRIEAAGWDGRAP